MKSRMKDLIEAGGRYLARGWRPIPIEAKGKQPLVKWSSYQNQAPSERDLESWFGNWPDANIAVLTGRASGLIAIDVDGPHGVSELAPHLGGVKTLTSITSRGRHLLFQHPGVNVPTRAAILPGVDVRGDGGYIVAPPSIHVSGHVYAWEGNSNITPALLPESLIKIICSETLLDKKPIAVAEECQIPLGTRNDTLARIAGRLLGQGLGESDALTYCLDVNAARCSPPLPNDEVARTVASIAHRERARGKPRTGKISAKNAPMVRFTTVPLTSVESRTTEWLWDGYIPRGKVVILDGDPGLGKSTVTLDMAARISLGREMPDGSRGVLGRVLIMTGEDGLDDTIRPRLDAACANLENIKAIRGVAGQLPQFPEDIAAIKEELVKLDAVLLIIDPLMSFLSGRVDSWKDQDIRRALSPLTAMAHETGAAVLVVRHLNKATGGRALYRGGGSIGLIGAARAGFLIAPHPDAENHLVFASTKSNLARKPPSLTLRLVDRHGVPVVEWGSPCGHSADDLVSRDTADKTRTLDEAISWLKQELKDGDKPVRDIRRKAAAKGFSEKTIERARSSLGVKALGAHDGRHWVGLPRREEEEEG